MSQVREGLCPLAVLACVFSLTPVTPTQAGVHFVKAGATGANDGTSWADAFVELQSALAAAGAGDEIWVAAGMYTPDYDTATARHTGDRTATFQLKSRVALFGGFTGSEIRPDQREPTTNITTLSGDLNSNDVAGSDKLADNSLHVVTARDMDESAILDGFRIANGNAQGFFPEGRCGGGLLVVGGKPTINTCAFQNNRAEIGGAVYNTENASPRFTDCEFISNVAHALGNKGGGGMWNDESTPMLVRCEFRQNTAPGGFGGALGNRLSNAILIACNFIDNSALGGGAGLSNDASSPWVQQCSFSRNTTRFDGAAVWNSSSHPRFSSCLFAANAAQRDGGGIVNWGSAPIIVNCRFVGNSAGTRGGGIWSRNGSAPVLINCVLVANSASEGAGVDTGNFRTATTLINCTFTANTASNLGAAIRTGPGGSSMLTNCILWGDTPDEIAGLADAKFSCIQNSGGAASGLGNIDVDPEFVDPGGADGMIGTEDDNVRLSQTSPCVDVGEAAVLPSDATDLDRDGDEDEVLPLDLDGKPRVMNLVVDMGAFELPTDCDASGVPDYVEIRDGTTQDCNDNILPDVCDIARGVSKDSNGNAVPDECEPRVVGRMPSPNSVVNRASGVTEVQVLFDRPVTATMGDVQVLGVISGDVTNQSILTGSGSDTISISFAGALPDRDRYTITVTTNVRSVAGRVPLSSPETWSFATLVGDCDRNGVVNIFDLAKMRSSLRTATFDDDCDIQEDGVVNIFDLAHVRAALREGAQAP